MDSLIDLLQQNALMPRADMARLLGRTPEDLDAIIAKLEADGVVLG